MKLKFDKDGLIPMIVQNANNGSVLSLFYANKEAIRRMKQTNYVWRYSRSRKKIMLKGETSGNRQKIVSISADCDRDALLIKAKPEGPACHTGNVSCFESSVSNSDLDLGILCELTKIIKKRMQQPLRNSYTSSIVKNRKAIIAKLREECEELIEARGKKNLAWEAADLLYFVLLYLENRNLPLAEVLKELRGRRNKSKNPIKN